MLDLLEFTYRVFCLSRTQQAAASIIPHFEMRLRATDWTDDISFATPGFIRIQKTVGVKQKVLRYPGISLESLNEMANGMGQKVFTLQSRPHIIPNPVKPERNKVSGVGFDVSGFRAC
jgi:hypothetical protein